MSPRRCSRWILATASLLALQAQAFLPEGGTELYLDGVDDYLTAFPSFDIGDNWTVEAWVKPAELDDFAAPQCLFHLATYSAQNLLMLAVDSESWRVRYGEKELAANISSSLSPQHVAVTHSALGNGSAALALYINGSLTASQLLPVPDPVQPPLAFIAGACHALARHGVARVQPFRGDLDEARHWVVARTGQQIQAALPFSGPPPRWPGTLDSIGLEAQYSFDILQDVTVVDTSGQGNVGVLGGSGLPREIPQYRPSAFPGLRLGSLYYEVLTVPDNIVTCPSANCLDLSDLLLGNVTTTYNGLRLLQAPTGANLSVSVNGAPVPVTAGMVTSQSRFMVVAEDPVAFDSFTLQRCRGTPGQAPIASNCNNEPIRTVALQVLAGRPPTAGEAYSLHLLGDSGFLELQQPLTTSGTLEFWAQFSNLAGHQTLFSVSPNGPAPMSAYMPVMSLGLVDGEVDFQICTVPNNVGAVAFVQAIQDIATTQQQHIAITWAYLRAARGRAVYSISIFQNCRLVSGPHTVEDACLQFGLQDASLMLPTFGQQYRLGVQGLVPSSYADVHLADIRLWDTARAAPDICASQRAWLNGDEPGLQARFVMGPADAGSADPGGAAVLVNQVDSGAPAALRCASTRHACPDVRSSRGYALLPSRFLLPAQPVNLVTSAGVLSQIGNLVLPPVEMAMAASGMAQVRVLDLPDAACGQLMDRSQQRLIQVNDSVSAQGLPLYFRVAKPTTVADANAFACQTSVTYVAVDAFGVDSPFNATVQLSVKVPGPQIIRAEAIAPGVNDTGPAVGDLLSLAFDRPTNRQTEWRGMFQVIAGSLGKSALQAQWNDVGDVLMLEVGEPVGSQVSKLEMGSCADQGLLPITDAASCLDAAQQLGLLGLQDTAVATSTNVGEPQGCFYLDGQAVILNTNPLNVGRGAETSVPGSPRLPLCVLPGVQLTAGATKFRFLGALASPLQTQGVDSYPAMGLSPALVGSFDERYCSNDTVFNMSTATCSLCGEGNYRSPDGLGCLPCPPGTIAPLPGMLECVLCQPGKYLPAGRARRSECIPVAPGQYVEEVGAAKPSTCPVGTVSQFPGSSGCSLCPEGADCEVVGTARTLAVPLPTYFRTSTGSIVYCQLPSACEGWSPSTKQNLCAPGMEGYMCQVCSSGWWRPHDKPQSLCSHCNGGSVVPFLVVLVLQSAIIWIVGAMSVDAACWGHMHSVIFRLALDYFSVVHVISRLEEWELAPAVGKERVHAIWASLDAIFRFDGGVTAHLMGLECLFGSRVRAWGDSSQLEHWQVIRIKTVFWILMPLLWPMFLVAVSVCLFEAYTMWCYIRWFLGDDPVKPENLRTAAHASAGEFVREPRFLGLIRTRAARCGLVDRLQLAAWDSTPLLLVGQFLFLPTVLRQLATVLTCDSLGEGSTTWRLYAAPEVVCWRGEHLAWALVSMSGVLLWGFALPGALMLLIWRNRGRLSDDVRLRALVGFLSDGYEEKWAYWEGVVYVRKMMVILIAVWPDLSRPAEMAFYQVIGVAALLLHYQIKPFDNRVGELLDRIELYGLCLFVFQVTVAQFVLLSDPEARYDLLAVFMACIQLAVAATLVALRNSTSRAVYLGASITAFLLVPGVMYWFAGGIEKRQLAVFLLQGFAIVVNAAYVLWLLLKVLREMGEALAENFARVRAREQKEQLAGVSRDVVQLALNSKSLLAEVLPYGSLTTKPPMPRPPGRSLRQRLMRLVMHANAHFNTAGALVWFDTSTFELVLGLHPDTFATDTRLTSYVRRKLAGSGPFLSDEEREFIAAGLRDAIVHIIVECETSVVDCRLLEFLVRLIFAQALQEQRRDLTDGRAVAQDLEEIAQDHAELVDMMFEEATFEGGINSHKFQAHLDNFAKMPKGDVMDLLERFVQAKERQAAG